MKQCWVTNGIESKRVFISELESYSSKGYVRGRKCPWNKFEHLSEFQFRPGYDKNRRVLTREEILLGSKVRKLFLDAKYKNSSFENLKSKEHRIRRILEEQNGSCGECGISEWQNKRIVLELHHMDGNNKNDSRMNLICLCPNCHSQTPNWKGKNKIKALVAQMEEAFSQKEDKCGFEYHQEHH